MKDLVRIEKACNDLDLLLEQAKASATMAGIARIEDRQILNDQAYFLLLWGPLETKVNDVCRAAIRRRIMHKNWQVRRSWYIYNPDDKRLSGLPFDDRAALVLDRHGGKGSAWAKVNSHYMARNGIAHGILRSTRIEIGALVQDCYDIQTALQRAA